MEPRELLRKTIAEFFEVDSSQVGPTFPITGPLVASSVGRAALDSRIRHQVGLKSNAVYSARTYAELEAEIIPRGPDSTAPSTGSFTGGSSNGDVKIGRRHTSPSTPAVGRQVSCGIDIELIESLPTATDYWEDAFYKENFTPAEIAYCLIQEKPALHFAARWCAKEALKKCDPDFLYEEMKNLELIAGESRQPTLNHYVGGEARRLPHAVSVSHAPLAAVAIVIKSGNEQAQPAVAPTAVASTSGAVNVPNQSLRQISQGRFAILQTLVALVALGLSVLALLKAHHLY
jgi:phosphopantetheine--protein transferase-like protein